MSDPIQYIKLARKTFDAEIGDALWHERRDFSRWEAWVDVIQLAAFRSHRVTTSHGVFELHRGEFLASLRWLSRRWNWTLKRVRNFLSTMLKWDRVRSQRVTEDGTIYLIVNYDTYQGSGHSKGTPEGTGGAHRGHTEGTRQKQVKAVTTRSTTLSDSSSDERRVLEHYLARHPRRRLGPKSQQLAAKALAMGYTAAELCAAIDGNADDDWHRKKNKHELSYVLRGEELIDNFIARAERNAEPLVDADGILTARGQAIMAGRA